MKSFRLAMVATLVLFFGITGCETMDGGLGNMLKGNSDNPCNVGVGAIAGGVVGALVNDKNRGKGALIGAGVGALTCVVVNAVSRQTKSSEQVETEYRSQHAGQLPPSEPVVDAYQVNVSPDSRVRAGEKVRVVSNMTVVRGSTRSVEEVKEVLTLSGAGGTKTLEKTASERPGSGAYENTFNLSFPKDVESGTYPIRTQLLVNGKQAAERKQNLVVVAVGETRQFSLVSR
jgi:outer membrane lipoprotein SlyB